MRSRVLLRESRTCSELIANGKFRDEEMDPVDTLLWRLREKGRCRGPVLAGSTACRLGIAAGEPASTGCPEKASLRSEAQVVAVTVPLSGATAFACSLEGNSSPTATVRLLPKDSGLGVLQGDPSLVETTNRHDQESCSRCSRRPCQSCGSRYSTLTLAIRM